MIPIEDINVIVLESEQVELTSSLLRKFAEEDIALFTCDSKHIPNGVLQPFSSHSRQMLVAKKQIESSEPFKKRCWQKIIRQKILNQAEILRILHKEGWKELQKRAADVDSGDTGNVEANAARFYFSNLFDDFRRFSDDGINAALNYGYAILRGAVSRSLCAYGFIPSIGVHHRSELNQYNLADDFIEPFRPIVDMWVAENKKTRTDLTKHERASLVGVLGFECILNEQQIAVRTAIDRVIASFSTACESNDWNYLILPKIISLKEHENE